MRTVKRPKCGCGLHAKNCDCEPATTRKPAAVRKPATTKSACFATCPKCGACVANPAYAESPDLLDWLRGEVHKTRGHLYCRSCSEGAMRTMTASARLAARR